MTETILNIIKARLGIDHDNLDELIKSYVAELALRIKHYCNIEEIPDGLYFVLASMVMDVLRVEQSSKPEFADASDTLSVKIGDTSVSPAISNKVTSTSKSIIDKVVTNYKSDLIAYRKLRW